MTLPRTQLVRILTIALLLTACARERELPTQGVPVRLEAAKRADFAPTLTLLGVIRAAQSVPVTALQHGIVTYPPRFAGGLRTGERVARGETLATIRNDQVLFSQRAAKLQMDAAEGEYERVKRSHDAGLVSAAEFSASQLRAALARENYANATRDVATLRLTSPAAGTLVVAHPVAPGTAVDATTVLGEIVSGGAPVVESNVAAGERTLLRPALAVKFTGRGTPPWSGTGRIAEVASVVDAAGTARVVSSIDRAGDVPPPGTGVELQVEIDHRRDVLTVPEDALVAGADGPALFVAGSAEGRATFRVKRVRVETGSRGNGRIEITAGLRDGDRVVVSGADSLADDALVTEAKDE
jgi:RND family efflux transporter MFP subunit